MSVENNATPAAETPTEAAAGSAAPDVDASAATTENEDLLGDVTDKQASDAPAGDEDAGDQKKADDGDDLLDGKVADGEEANAEADSDYELTVPEGHEYDAELADTFKPVAKELGLTKDQAQGLVDKYAPQMLAQIGEKQAAAWKAVQKQWASEAKSDPEFGGKNLEQSLSNVARARDYLGPEFAAAIKLLGGSNNPALLKGLAKVGQALGEDTPGFGKPAVAPKTAAERLYPNDQPNKE